MVQLLSFQIGPLPALSNTLAIRLAPYQSEEYTHTVHPIWMLRNIDSYSLEFSLTFTMDFRYRSSYEIPPKKSISMKPWGNFSNPTVSNNNEFFFFFKVSKYLDTFFFQHRMKTCAPYRLTNRLTRWSNCVPFMTTMSQCHQRHNHEINNSSNDKSVIHDSYVLREMCSDVQPSE